MAVMPQWIKMLKSFFFILFFVVVFKTGLYINKLRRISTEGELQIDDSATGNLDSNEDMPLDRGIHEFQEGTLTFRHLMSLFVFDIEDKNCTQRGINSFWTPFTNEQRVNGAIIIHFLVAFYMSGMIAYNCSIYFVPSLEVLCEELNIQPDVAGATFMAAGSSIPEFFSALIGTFISEDDTGLSAIIGSAAFNVFVITSCCCFFAEKDVPITWWPLFRDGSCYVLSLVLLVLFIYDSKAEWWEGLVMACTYLLYILLMYFNPYLSEKATNWSWRRHVEQDKQKLVEQNGVDKTPYGTLIEEPHLECMFTTKMKEVENHVSIEENKMQQSGQTDPNNTKLEYNESQNGLREVYTPPQNIVFRLLWIIGLPTVVLMFITIPDCRKPRWRKWFFVSLFVSLLWLLGTSYVLYWMVVVMGYTFGIPDTVLGLTLLAGVTSVPDLLSSVLVTRHGFGDMALSNVIGSNTFEVLICFGLLWFLKGVFDEPVTIATDGLAFTSISLMITIAFVVIAIHINGWKLNIRLGVIFVMVYLVFIVLAILIELGLLGDIAPPIYCPGPF